jgi:hypothetical protein
MDKHHKRLKKKGAAGWMVSRVVTGLLPGCRLTQLGPTLSGSRRTHIERPYANGRAIQFWHIGLCVSGGGVT